MKAFIVSSVLLALATADSCSDCTAVVSTIAARLSSAESVAAQQVVMVKQAPETMIEQAQKLNTQDRGHRSQGKAQCNLNPYFQAILVGGLCPTAEDVAGCEANLPGFWAAIAAVLWPGYWDPTVSRV